MNQIVRIVASVLAVSFVLAGLYIYSRFIAAPTVPKDFSGEFLHIPTNSTYEEVFALLEEKDLVNNARTFHFLAEKMNYKRDPMRSGRFEVKSGWTMVDLIRHLRNGEQAPVKVVLTNERLPEEVAVKVARFLEPESKDFEQLFSDKDYLEKIGYTEETLMSLFIPNTYEMYWNSNPEDFLKRMIKEHDKFWSKKNRESKAKEKEMTPAEVYTLASIVERETLQKSGKARMAGVYLNRLEKGMRLQADPYRSICHP